jgi:hypothetical protein
LEVIMSKSGRITRRSFLRKTAGVAAGAAFPYFVPSSALGKAGAVAPSNRIVMGAIGYGWQGGGNTKGFLQKPEVQYVAVCDVDKNHLEKAKATVDDKYGNKDCAAYDDFRELLARGDLDAVNIALPDHWHSIPVIMAAEAGLDIPIQSGGTTESGKPEAGRGPVPIFIGHASWSAMGESEKCTALR